MAYAGPYTVVWEQLPGKPKDEAELWRIVAEEMLRQEEEAKKAKESTPRRGRGSNATR